MLGQALFPMMLQSVPQRTAAVHRQHHRHYRHIAKIAADAVSDTVTVALGAPYSAMHVSVGIAKGIAAGVSEVYQRVTAAAIAAGVPVNIAHAVVKVESRYNVNERGAAGEVGIMQVLPQTARAMGENPYNLDGNLRAGMKYLALALRTSRDLCAAISGYNHGIAARPHCTSYGRKVMALAR